MDYEKDYTFRRGDICWYEDHRPIDLNSNILQGNHPVVVVSANRLNEVSSLVTVVPMTTNTLKKIYANQTAKAAISEYQTDSWMQNADEAEKKYGISQEMYISIRTNASGLKSLKDADGNTITNSLSLLKMKLVYDTPGLNEKQRQAMFEYLGVGKKVRHYNKALVEQKLQEMRKK